MPSFLPISPVIPYSPLISPSTPAGRSSFVSASTVWERVSMMSISRLWVFSSNCSRLFLSMCGLRSTVHSWRFVGSGMGPDTCAPVFSAVRTMSAAAWSMSAWSNALRRIRILPAIRSSQLPMAKGQGPLAVGRWLLQNLGDHPRPHRAAALADREAQLLLHRDRRDPPGPHLTFARTPHLLLQRDRREQLDRLLRVVPRHHHLHPRRQLHRPRDVRGPQVELRPVPLEKRRVPPPLLLRQHVYLTLKLRVRRDRFRLRQHHPPLHFVLLHAAQQQPHVVPRLPLVQELAEHLHPRHHRLLVRPKPHRSEEH